MGTYQFTTRQGIYHQQLAALAENRPVWLRPEIIALGLPYATESGKKYVGINVLLLWLATEGGASLAAGWTVRPIRGPSGEMNQQRPGDGVMVHWAKIKEQHRLMVRIVERVDTAPLAHRPQVPKNILSHKHLWNFVWSIVNAYCRGFQAYVPPKWTKLYAALGEQALELITQITCSFFAASWEGVSG